ncbi:MAG: two component transcriptional regulator, winged helix family [Phycisphaerales bacterium]|nr:two component transcriptional regulator, winged helix family [Phycisphaerales bacterium]
MRLLVAEDHPSLARSLAEGLREEGYAVDLTSDGAEAAHLIRGETYDGVVLDIMLPNVDGWALLALIRQHQPRLPVLCLTARDGVDDRVRGLDLGADDYLVKPFSWQELLARVRAIVRRGHGQASAVITVGDLSIDTARRAVSRAGRPIPLSAREYGLLEYLGRRQGEVVPRTDIWNHLYDRHDEASSNVVDVYVGYLRAKIDKGFDAKLIHTRRGMGYVLGPPG